MAVEAFDGIIGPDAPPGKKFGFIFAIIFLVLFILVLAVVLTLPETYSCYPEDNSYFVKVIPNTSISTVDPPMVCLAEMDQTINVSGAYFLRQGNGEQRNDQHVLTFYWAAESMTSNSAANPQIQSQGDYSGGSFNSGDPARYVYNLLTPYAIWLHEASEAVTFNPVVAPGTVNLTVTWSNYTCEDALTILGIKAGPKDAAGVAQYDLTFYDRQQLRKQFMRQCSSFEVTLPMDDTLTQYVIPELFITNPNGPHPHPVALPSSRKKPPSTKGRCQHSTFGELVVLPRPRLRRIDPPFVCDASNTVMTFSGEYFIQHRQLAGAMSLEKPTTTASDFTIPF